MKLESILYLGSLAATAVASPLAQLERQHHGRTLDRTTQQLHPELSNRINQLQARAGGSSSRSKKRPKDPLNPKYKEDLDRSLLQRSRSIGPPEAYRDYARESRDAPKYVKGSAAAAYRDNTPPMGSNAFMFRKHDDGVTTRDYYYGDDMYQTSHHLETTYKVYPQYDPRTTPARFRDRPSGEQDIRRYTLENPEMEGYSGKTHDREEEPPQSVYYPPGQFLVSPVPRVESTWQSGMFKAARAPKYDDRGATAERYFPNSNKPHPSYFVARGPPAAHSNGAYTTDPRYTIPTVPTHESFDYLYPGQRPVYKESDYYDTYTIAPRSRGRSSRSRSPKDDYDVDYRDRGYKRDEPAFNDKRQILGEIQGEQANATDTSTVVYQQQIQAYIWAFEDAQANATQLLVPFLIDLLDGTNSYLGEAMAWSLYEMVHPSVTYQGPFKLGQSFFGASENSTATSAGNSTSGGVSEDYLSWVGAVDQFYQEMWGNATEAVNATGLLAELDRLSENLQPQDTTLLPDSWTTVDSHDNDVFFDFLALMYSYNEFDFTTANTTNGTADTSFPGDYFGDLTNGTNGTGGANGTSLSKRAVAVDLNEWM